MAKRRRYVCSSCGQVETGWTGKCPACGEWGTMEEQVIDTSISGKTRGNADRDERVMPALALSRVPSATSDRLDTGFQEVNRVLGGGLVKDSVTMVTARPGAGKSTLLLQLAEKLARRGLTTLYASGEESPSQIKGRADRIFDRLPDKVYLIATNSMDRVEEEVRRLKPQLLVLDSVQTFEKRDFAQRAGTPTQTLAVADAVVSLSKSSPRPMASFIVGHMTKSGEMAGLRTLEHLVDTVLFLEDGYDDRLRMLRASKNRFGYTGEVGLFQMGEKGMEEVKDPYALFLTKRDKPVAGAAISLQREGSRMIPIEIEALVSTAYEAYPSRIGDTIKRDQLNTLIAILEQKAGLLLSGKNVVLKATGGLVIKEKVCDLPILVAIASSLKNAPIDSRDVFLAEVGLTGDLKKVDGLDQRLKELSRLGFRRAFVPAFTEEEKRDGLEVVPCRTIGDVLNRVLRS